MKATTRVTTVVPVEDLALLKKYWTEKNGVNLSNFSKLVSTSLELLVDLLKDAQLVKPFESQQKAWDYLVEQRMVTKSFLVEGRKSLVKALQYEALSESGTPAYGERLIGRRDVKKSVPASGHNAAGVDKIFNEIKQSLGTAKQTAVDDHKQALEDAQALLDPKLKEDSEDEKS